MKKTIGALLVALWAAVPAYAVDFHIHTDPATGVVQIIPQQPAREPLVPIATAATPAAAALPGTMQAAISRPVAAAVPALSGPRSRFAALVEQAAAETRVDPALLHAVIRAESSYNPRAISRAGAVGLMQLMPATARRFGVYNLFDPAENIRAGARYLAFLLKTFGNDTTLALAAYNAGEGAVQRYGRRIPPYSETQKYVPKVLRFYEQYRQI